MKNCQNVLWYDYGSLSLKLRLKIPHSGNADGWHSVADVWLMNRLMSSQL